MSLEQLLEGLAGVWELTSQQRRVLGLLARGMAHKEVADALGISPRTVEVHTQRILIRAGVQSRSELFALLLQNALHTTSCLHDC